MSLQSIGFFGFLLIVAAVYLAPAAALAESVSAGGQLVLLRQGHARHAACHYRHCRVYLRLRPGDAAAQNSGAAGGRDRPVGNFGFL